MLTITVVSLGMKASERPEIALMSDFLMSLGATIPVETRTGLPESAAVAGLIAAGAKERAWMTLGLAVWAGDIAWAWRRVGVRARAAKSTLRVIVMSKGKSTHHQNNSFSI